MTDQPGDEVLAARARAGNVDAFELLVRRHRHRAYLIALRMTGNRHDAEDVTQDAFTQAWRSLPHFRGTGSFGTWLYRIVVNRSHNVRRGARPEQSLPFDDQLSATPGVDLEVEAALQREAAVRAVAALPFDQRAALVLHYFADCSLAETARILHISEPAAKVRIFRARRTLADRLKEWR